MRLVSRDAGWKNDEDQITEVETGSQGKDVSREPLPVPDPYVQRQVELAQVEAYDEAPYILGIAEADSLKKLYSIVSGLLLGKSSELEHIDIAQRYFQYSYTYNLTNEARLKIVLLALSSL